MSKHHAEAPRRQTCLAKQATPSAEAEVPPEDGRALSGQALYGRNCERRAERSFAIRLLRACRPRTGRVCPLVILGPAPCTPLVPPCWGGAEITVGHSSGYSENMFTPSNHAIQLSPCRLSAQREGLGLASVEMALAVASMRGSSGWRVQCRVYHGQRLPDRSSEQCPTPGVAGPKREKKSGHYD